jgi:hypothetical protein
MIPENNGAPDASAMPRHRGRATRKTTTPEGKSFFRYLNVKPGIIFFPSIKTCYHPDHRICDVRDLKPMRIDKN